MTTARKHFEAKGSAAAFALLKKTQGFNVGAIRMPFPDRKTGKLASTWIIFWSAGFLRPGSSRRA
jgi:hypothetical protein